jgi:hypothetical protein
MGRAKFDMGPGWRKVVLESQPPLKSLARLSQAQVGMESSDSLTLPLL